MVGGDYQTTLAGHVGTNSLMPDEARFSAFGRASYDLTNNIEIFAQFGWNRYIGESYYQQTPSTGVTIRGDNAYLQSMYPTVAAALGNSSANTITIGTSNAGYPCPAATTRATSIAMSSGQRANLTCWAVSGNLTLISSMAKPSRMNS
jgi:hypothetical protein